MQEEKINQLIHDAQNGDPNAFEKIIKLYNRDLYKVAYAILKNDEDVADALQDTLLACWEHLDSLKKPGYFKTWLIRILINKCYRILDSRYQSMSIDDIPEAGREDSYNIEFKEAISMLGDKYRLAAVLYYCEGFKTKEISEMLDIPDATVRTRLKRARNILRKYYEEGK